MPPTPLRVLPSAAPPPDAAAPPRPVESPGALVLRVCDEYGITLEELRGPARHKHLVAARRTITAALHPRGFSLAVIGRALGGRDHSTVLNYLVPRKASR